MEWSPGRYGPYPSTKRPSAWNDTRVAQRTYAQVTAEGGLQGNELINIIPETQEIRSQPIERTDSPPLRITIIRDKSPAEVFGLSTEQRSRREGDGYTQTWNGTWGAIDSGGVLLPNPTREDTWPRLSQVGRSSKSSKSGGSRSEPKDINLNTPPETREDSTSQNLNLNQEPQQGGAGAKLKQIRAMQVAARYKAKWLYHNKHPLLDITNTNRQNRQDVSTSTHLR